MILGVRAGLDDSSCGVFDSVDVRADVPSIVTVLKCRRSFLAASRGVFSAAEPVVAPLAVSEIK